jgi:hypothetical protein
LTEYGAADARLPLPKLEIGLEVAELYRQVEFGEIPEGADAEAPS